MNQLTIYLKQKEDLVSETGEQLCKRCQGKMVESNYCVECRNPVFARCTRCNQKELVDLHEFCYCQLELYNA